jgi:hypothetical protein
LGYTDTRMARVDFAFIVPSRPSELRAAVADCLEPILNAGVDTELLEPKEPKGENNGTLVQLNEEHVQLLGKLKEA